LTFGKVAFGDLTFGEVLGNRCYIPRSTMDQVFTLRRLSEKYIDARRNLCICYVDFRKAFSSVWRKGLWKLMRCMGYREKITRILESLYFIRLVQ